MNAFFTSFGVQLMLTVIITISKLSDRNLIFGFCWISQFANLVYQWGYQKLNREVLS